MQEPDAERRGVDADLVAFDQIVMQLAGFERYSAECLSRSPADAALHRHLGEVAGAARTLFERAVERLVAEEGLVLTPQGAPAAV